MKRTTWVKYLPVILASTCLAPVTLTQAYPASPVTIAQAASSYDSYMRLGYSATVRRDYSTALVNFRRALSVRPGDRYATDAIRNVSNYLAARQGGGKIGFRDPSGTGAPDRRRGGATRSASINGCLNSQKPPTALVPQNAVGLTTADYPVIFFYVPQNSAQNLEFLVDANNGDTYKTSVPTPPTSGIISFSLSALKNSNNKSLPPLESGKKYSWNFSIICDSQDSSNNVSLDGLVERKKLDPVLANELQKAAPRARVSLYLVADIWYDRLATLAKLRGANPNDSSLINEWVEALKSVGLDDVANEPLVGCCTPNK